MIPLAIGPEVIAAIQICFAADVPLMLSGPPGVGKSQILEEAAAAIDIGCIVQDLSLLEPPDLLGMPRVEGSVVRYAPPAWLPYGGKGLLVIEEINRAPRYMRAPALQLLTARRLNEFRLPCGWLPVAAINEAEDGCDVDDLDGALLSRFAVIRVRPDATAWLEWARRHEVHPAVLQLVGDCPIALEAREANPRSWSYAGRILTSASPETPRGLLLDLLTGLLGDLWGRRLVAVHVGGSIALTHLEILHDYPAHGFVVRQWAEEGRAELLNASWTALRNHLERQENYDAVVRDLSQLQNVCAFFTHLPNHMRAKVEKWRKGRKFEGLSVEHA